jgi:putative ABC transport system substrate-binding protein
MPRRGEGTHLNPRRQVLIALGLGMLAGPRVILGQQPGRVWRVGFLALRHVDLVDTDYYYGPFRQGMRELGYVEGRNLAIEWRSAEGKAERLPALAAELVQLKVDVIVTAGTPAASAAQKATSTLPIVMATTVDPVGSGFVKSLSHPATNMTGLSNLTLDIGPKTLEIMVSMVPKLSLVAVLVNPANPAHAAILKSTQNSAQKLNVKVLPVEARTAQEIERAFSVMARERAGAVIVAIDAFFIQQGRQIADLAAKHRLPSMSGSREYVEAGGLMSYGQNLADNYRRAATYVDKILKGAKPGDLPVEQPTTFELFINRRTAKAIGLAIPQELLLRADRVIE